MVLMTRILIVTPARRGSRQGNRITATRWASILRSLGHSVRIVDHIHDGAPKFELLIALHARKSAEAVQQVAEREPRIPIVLALTGTDLYEDLRSSRLAQSSLELASRLVLLQPHGCKELPSRFHSKVRVIHQSATGPKKRPKPLARVFEICVSGHLRAVKDPFRAALAARGLPESSRIRITHIGAALAAEMRERARAEMQRNPRYRWLGEVPPWRARHLLARSRLLVLSSKLEGGANVVSEALAARVPVLSSRISGSIGLLGEEYPGYFEVGDTVGLAQLMIRCETDRAFYTALAEHCRRRSALVRPQRERSDWRELLEELVE